jgi:hypothetical protein
MTGGLEMRPSPGGFFLTKYEQPHNHLECEHIIEAKVH